MREIDLKSENYRRSGQRGQRLTRRFGRMGVYAGVWAGVTIGIFRLAHPTLWIAVTVSLTPLALWLLALLFRDD